MVGCSAAAYANNSTNNKLRFHCSPKLIELRKKWLQAMRRVAAEEDLKAELCSAHFKPEGFKRDLKASDLRC